MKRCDECGYAYDSLQRDQLVPTLRAFGPQYGALLEGDDADLRAHPLPDTWSILEYGCHMRDVFRVQRERVELALVEDEPTFVSMRRDERAIEERYNEQSPEQVGRELSAAADAIAGAFDALDEGGWQRSGVYSYPERKVRTLEWVARHTVHEGVHHLMDIERLRTAL